MNDNHIGWVKTIKKGISRPCLQYNILSPPLPVEGVIFQVHSFQYAEGLIWTIPVTVSILDAACTKGFIREVNAVGYYFVIVILLVSASASYSSTKMYTG